jgi:DNA-binding LytR/AlgR family response regulator
MLSCYVIDDENASVELLINYIQKTPFLKLVGSTTNPLAAMQFVQEEKIDLFFLDIHMPHISGIDFMRIMNSQGKVILVTASPEHALEGFEYNVVDYLLKPVSFERFLKASQRALALAAAPGVPAGNPREELPADLNGYLWVKTENKGKMIKINFSEIVYVQGLKNYLSIYTEQDHVITLMNIKDLDEYLPKSQFMRIHKSYIISLSRIKAVDGNRIMLRDMKAYLPLGETYRSLFFKNLEQYTIGGKSKSG